MQRWRRWGDGGDGGGNNGGNDGGDDGGNEEGVKGKPRDELVR